LGPLGFILREQPHIRRMDSVSPSEPRGFSFPGIFEVTAFGPAGPELETIVLAELTAAGFKPDPGSVRQRNSSAGNYRAVAVSFWVEDRVQYDEACTRLREHPAIKWLL